MKKRLFLFLTVISLILALASCSFSLPGTGGEENEEENLIYNEKSELYLIVGGGVDGTLASNLSGAIDSERSVALNYAPADSDPHKHEIVLGRTDREISKAAILRLERLDKDSADDLGYLIYSDGSSVAIVYEEDGDGLMAKLAIEYFINNYVKSTLVCKSGTVYSETLNILEDYYGARDEEYINGKWAEFEAASGKELTDAFKRLYSIYSPGMLSWMANLYDPDICVCVDLYGEAECSGTKYCGTGGFYYSNSARDTIGYLPDAESTNQTLNFLASSGMGYLYNDLYAEFLPKDMLDNIAEFILALQEPNGYFYHPQWGIEFTDTKIPRRARDLNWSVSILNHLGRRPNFTTPSGVQGSGAAPAVSPLTLKMGNGSVIAVSGVVAANSESYAAHLQSLDDFKAYLEAFKIREESYYIGNELTSQTTQIIARDKEIGTESNPTPLMDYLIFWLNENQNPETGHWDYKKPTDDGYDAYYGVNGLLKISGIYTDAHRVIPYAKEAAFSAMKAITDEQEIDAVVDLYNTWFAIRNILQNLRKYGDTADKAEADEIVRTLRAEAVRGVDVSREKISAFMKKDGSFSYGREYSAPNSQGCPAAVPNSVEGDVNGNVIASTGLISYILGALELLEYRVPLFGEKDRLEFIDTIENLSPITKVEDVTVPEPITFEFDKVGSSPEDVTYELSKDTESYITVVKDPTDSGMGNVVEFASYSGGGDYLRVENETTSSLAKTAVFEGDFCLVDSDVEYSVQFALKNLYMLAFKVIDGKIHVREVSSETSANGTEEELGIVADLGKWFSIKVEYYPGDHNSVRIKIYADTDLSDGKDLKLYAVSDNYYDQSGIKYLKTEGKPSANYSGAEFYVMNKPNLKMYVDNINCYKLKTSYSPVIDPDNQPLTFNVDAPDKERVVYDFAGNIIPDDIVYAASDGEIKTADEALSISFGGGKTAPSVTYPLTVRTAGSRCGYVSFDITVSEIAHGGRIALRGLDGGKNIFGIDLVADGSRLSFAGVGKDSEAPLGELVIEKGEKATVRLEYYHSEDRVFVYLDDAFVGESRNLYSEGYKMTMDAFSVIVESSASIIIDNVITEKTDKSFGDAVKPIVDPKVWDFETEEEEVKLSGAKTKYTVVSGDTMIELDSSKSAGSLSVPVNNRATLYTAANFDAEISITSASADGMTHLIEINAPNGKTLVSFALVRKGTRIELYEVWNGETLSAPLYTYSTLKNIKLSLKIFADNKIIYVYNNGTAVAKSSIFAADDILLNGYGNAVIKSGDTASVALIDDVGFETLYELYSSVTVNSKGNTENSLKSPLTFESSNTGNIPGPVGVGLAGVNSDLRVERVERDGENTNVLSFYTVAGSNDFVNFTSPESLNGYSAVAFEADVLLDISTEKDTTLYQIYFSSKDSKDKVYFLQFAKAGDSFYIVDKSDQNNNDRTVANTLKTGLKGGEWFKFRVEYYRSAEGEVRFVVSINGEVCSVSDNYFGSSSQGSSPAETVECFYFYTLSACEGTIVFDNVTLYGFNGSCEYPLTTTD